MANLENVSAADLNRISAGELLDFAHGQLIASNAIHGGRGGVIDSLDHRRTGQRHDGIGRFSPGTDRARSLDIRATMANQAPMARKQLGNDKPRRLHTLVEYGDRYDYATGRASLRGLSRLMLGLTCIAAEKANAGISATFVGADRKTVVIEESSTEPSWVLDQFDKFITNRVDTPVKSDTLSSGLLAMTLSDEGPREHSDVALVISDFLADTQRDRAGNVVGFGWESGMQELHGRLDDRLYVARLTTPAQDTMHSLQATNGEQTVDFDQIVALQANYHAQAEQKQAAIDEALKYYRVLELGSTAITPIIDATDFLFGVPDLT